MNTDRRAFLVAASGTLASVAGCLSSDDSSNQSDQDTSNQSNGTQSTGNQSDQDTGDQSDPSSVSEATRQFVQLLAGSEFDQAYQQLTDRAQQLTSAGELEAVWLGFSAVGGSYGGIEGVETTVRSGFDAGNVTLDFERGTHVMQVVFGDTLTPRSAVVGDEYERPDYVDPARFESREASLETESCKMDATVALPTDADTGDGVPGVVLVHGSDPVGAADKDLTNRGSKVFTDLGEGLATQGVATMRYDRRTNACPRSLEPSEYTLDAVSVDDALLAIERLRETDGVDPDRIVVAGHSLGGLAMPRIVERDGNLAGGIGLAAPARSFHEIFIDQFEYLATVGEFEWDRMQQAYEQWRDRIDRIRQGDYNPGDIVLDYPGALWDSVTAYDHIETARQTDVPLLFLQGSRDYQVTVEDDLSLWQSELDGRQATTFREYDGLNHLFKFGEGPSVPTAYPLRNPVEEAVVTDIADWAGER